MTRFQNIAIAAFIWLIVTPHNLFAQEDLGQFSGNFQIDGQLYRPDTAINAVVPPEKMALSGFGNLLYTRGKLSGGIRFETYIPAPVAYPAGAKWTGTGIGYRFARYSEESFDITVGNFYEQFGSGMVLRTWEDRGLGVDYSLDGVRVITKPYRGISITALYGKQRFNFNNGLVNGGGIVRGVNADIDISEMLDSLMFIPGQLMIGGSFVSKYERNTSSQFDYPENVGAGSLRMKYSLRNFQLAGEYAFTGENPSRLNSQIIPIPPDQDPGVGLWLPGNGINLNATYSQKGFGISLTASTLANMSFQSERNAGPFDSWINYLPPTSILQTYLLAQLYPYATQPNGEVSYRGELYYHFKKESLLGGATGLKFDMSFTQIKQPRITMLDDLGTTRNGAEISLFRSGELTYYADFNAKLSKTISKKFKASLFYMNLVYNNDVIQGAYDFNNEAAKGTVYADMIVFEGNLKVNRTNNLRFEIQALFTDQHLQDWLSVVAEYTVSPHWFFSAINQYNYGNADGDFFNFPVGSLGYIKDSSRISLSYGRQRAGVFCVGGICRVVPAANGLTINITSSF